ncbi:NAD(P)-dependent oxidoreductase [Allobaculum sp. Allo2]|uniref:NAD(P)-dependent oxidoreductase n=1 Tax=Allobaculum sp. Allo2 TaxID=2853432 RepID=UPI0034632399|nr:hypothetical protein KWG61_02620 [Allobaculum sp. Allo2]
MSISQRFRQLWSGDFRISDQRHPVFYRRYPFLLENRKKKEWNRNIGTIDSIYGKTILVLGCGDLGSTFARSVKALGAHTIDWPADAEQFRALMWSIRSIICTATCR